MGSARAAGRGSAGGGGDMRRRSCARRRGSASGRRRRRSARERSRSSRSIPRRSSSRSSLDEDPPPKRPLELVLALPRTAGLPAPRLDGGEPRCRAAPRRRDGADREELLAEPRREAGRDSRAAAARPRAGARHHAPEGRAPAVFRAARRARCCGPVSSAAGDCSPIRARAAVSPSGAGPVTLFVGPEGGLLDRRGRAARVDRIRAGPSRRAHPARRAGHSAAGRSLVRLSAGSAPIARICVVGRSVRSGIVRNGIALVSDPGSRRGGSMSKAIRLKWTISSIE